MVLSILSFVDIKPASASGDFWTQKAPMHVARGGLGVAVVNGKIYAIGGSTESGYLAPLSGIVDTNEEYDPIKNTWVFKSQMPTPRTGLAVAAWQGKIFCMGGVVAYNSSGFVTTTVNEVYDIPTDTWTTKKPLPTARSWLSANVVDDKFYLTGGEPDRTLNQVYDPATDTWTTLSPMPNGVTAPASATSEGKIYFIDGYGPRMSIYNTRTDSWTIGNPSPSAVEGAAGATSGSFAPVRVYFFGLNGWMDQGPMPNRIYDPKTDNWTFGANVPTNRMSFGVVVLNDTLYVIGGRSLTFPYPGDYDIVTQSAANEQYTPVGYGTPDPSYQPISPTPSTSPSPTQTFSPTPSSKSSPSPSPTAFPTNSSSLSPTQTNVTQPPPTNSDYPPASSPQPQPAASQTELIIATATIAAAPTIIAVAALAIKRRKR